MIPTLIYPYQNSYFHLHLVFMGFYCSIFNFQSFMFSLGPQFYQNLHPQNHTRNRPLVQATLLITFVFPTASGLYFKVANVQDLKLYSQLHWLSTFSIVTLTSLFNPHLVSSPSFLTFVFPALVSLMLIFSSITVSPQFTNVFTALFRVNRCIQGRKYYLTAQNP